MPEPDWRDWLARLQDALERHFRDLDLQRWWAAFVLYRRWTVPLTLVVLLTLLFASVILADYRATAVPPVGAAAIEPPTVLLDVHGEPVGPLDQAELGEEVAARDLPDHVVQAVLAAEDREFWDHRGFSLRGTVRALLANLRDQAIQQGGSTITQQYVDLTTEGDARSYRGKLREMIAAVKYERDLGKSEILDRYLNIVPFGRDTSGIDAAAHVYFDVRAAELDVNQAATLAGMIAAPSSYDPGNNPEGARHRRDVVVRGMGDSGWLEADQVDAVIAKPLPELRDGPLVQFGDDAYFVDAVRRRLEKLLPDHRDLSRGLVVKTTVAPRMQQVAQETVADHVGDAEYTGAAVTIDPATGGIRALVGGPDFEAQSYNSAVQALRQPGSAFKPFVLASFIDAGYSPDESVFPAPRELDIETPQGTKTVENFDGESFDDLDVREATEKSVNTVYMQLIEEVSASRVSEVAGAMGIEGEVPAVPSLALGTASVSPVHMASAYATLAAGGVFRAPHLITEITDADGKILYEHSPTEEEVVSEQVAGLVTDVLEGVITDGTGEAADIDWPVAGKTGTTDDSRDAWFAGYTAQLATVVWVGMADNSPMGDVTGGELAAPMWQDLMSELMEPFPEEDLLTADDDGLEGLDRTPDDPPPPSRKDRDKDDDKPKPPKPRSAQTDDD